MTGRSASWGRQAPNSLLSASTGALLIVLLLLLQTGTVWAAPERRAFAQFAEFQVDGSTGTYYGVHGHWTDEDWSGIICPENHGNTNRVNTLVNAFGQYYDDVWVQIGYQKRRYWASDSQCVLDLRYYWEWRVSEIDYNKETISPPSPLGTHDFSLNRLSTGCRVGVAWCWHFRIDGVTEHTCCGDVSQLAQSHEIDSALECVWYNDNISNPGDCPAGGLVDPVDELTRKLQPSGTWDPWGGKDGACVDYTKEARGKWLSVSSFKAGYNIIMSDSLLNSC